MKIFRRNTESILYEKVKSLRTERSHVWRCIHIELRYNKERPEKLHFTGRVACELLANEDGFIFLCNDGDIFILFKGALRPILRRLSVYFEDFHPDSIRHASNINVFDLGHDWETFFELCRRRALGYDTPSLPDRELPLPTTVQF